MTFKKRTSLTGLVDSNWMDWAVQRTGVAMPNCVTYATARISEILGRKEYLDDPRVNGAQELWDNYSDGFNRSKYAVEGALMIWQYGQFGHVAVCEELIDTNTIAWSQSNYGGATFEYIKGNPNGYLGMQFLGYLVHDKLPKVEDSKPAKPSASQKDSTVLNNKPSDWVAETATFTCTVDKINIRKAPSTKGKLTGDWYENGMSVHYDGYVKRDGYIWISWIGKDGTRRWMAAGTLGKNGYRDKAYGTFGV